MALACCTARTALLDARAAMQVRMRQTDLIQVDTFRMDCSKDSDTAQEWAHLHMNQKWRSALEIIVAHEKHEFAQDELFNKLVMSKWTKFGRRMYLQRTVIPYIVLLVAFPAVLAAAIFVGPGFIRQRQCGHRAADRRCIPRPQSAGFVHGPLQPVDVAHRILQCPLPGTVLGRRRRST